MVKTKQKFTTITKLVTLIVFQGGDFFPEGDFFYSDLRSFRVATFHRRGVLFSSIRLFNRDIITFSSQ